MTKKGGSNDWSDVMTEEEYKNMDDFFSKYEFKYPGSEEINRTVETVRFHMRMKAGHKRGSWERMKRLLRLTASEFIFISPTFWIVSAALYLAGFIMIGLEHDILPEFALFVLSPMPFILGLVEVFRCRDERMLELEMSCTYNAPSIMLSKLCIVGMYSILLNAICSMGLAGAAEQVHLMDITLLWMTPFTVLSGLSLAVAIRLRGSAAVVCMMSIWLGFCMIIILNPSLMRSILTMHAASCLLLIAMGVIMTATQISRLLMRTKDLEGAYPH